MAKTKLGIVEACGVKIALYGSVEFNGILKTLEEKGENAHGKHYIILSKEPISLEKRAEVREWYSAYINDLAMKAQNPKRSVQKRAKKLLKQLGWELRLT